MTQVFKRSYLAWQPFNFMLHIQSTFLENFPYYSSLYYKIKRKVWCGKFMLIKWINCNVFGMKKGSNIELRMFYSSALTVIIFKHNLMRCLKSCSSQQLIKEPLTYWNAVSWNQSNASNFPSILVSVSMIIMYLSQGRKLIRSLYSLICINFSWNNNVCKHVTWRFHLVWLQSIKPRWTGNKILGFYFA